MSSNSSQSLHAEISIIPVGTSSTGISKEVAAAFDAISKVKDIKTTKLTGMGTQIEANNMTAILKAIEVAHQAVRSAGAKRIISTIYIAERLDKTKTLEDNVTSVERKLPKD